MNLIVARAIKAAGSPTALANAAGVKLPSIYSWTRIPADKVVAVEALTGIPRHELRPDVFPSPDPVPASTPAEAVA